MRRSVSATAVALFMFVCAAPAFAQNLSLRAPDWAQALLASDIIPTTGGRNMIAGEGIAISVRVTIAPPRGGVARVIRYDQRDDGAQLFVRRFTGHPGIGWWLWGSDAPRITPVTQAQQQELAGLARSAAGVGGVLGATGVGEICPAGEQVYIEIALGGRASAQTRACVQANDAAGRLALRLSTLAGSRTEEELAQAAVSELLDADRAFAAKAARDGVSAAFTEYAAEDAQMVSRANIVSGREGVTERFARWPEGARLEWAPETGRVSERGDMGWTWGNSVYVAPDGTRTPGRYITVWKRDYDGNWRFAFDAGID